MNKKITLYLLLFCSITYGQIFNRSFVVHGNEHTPSVLIDDSLTVALYGSSISFFTNPVIHVLNSKGQSSVHTLNMVSDFSGLKIELLLPEGLYKMPDGNYLAYGSYSLGCDYLVEVGLFLVKFDASLQIIKSKTIRDSSAFHYKHVLIDSNQFAIRGYNSVFGFDLALKKVFEYQDTSNTGYFSNVFQWNATDLLVEKVSYSGNRSYTYFDFSDSSMVSSNHYPSPIFELTDTTFFTYNPTNSMLVSYLKQSNLKVDSINLMSITGFSPLRIEVSGKGLIVCDSNTYFILSVSDFVGLGSGTIRSYFSKEERGNRVSFHDSSLAVISAMSSGQIHLERIEINKPKANPLSGLTLKVGHVATYLTRQELLAPNHYLVNSLSDWKVVVYNNGTEEVNTMNLNYQYYPQSNCSGTNVTIPFSGLNFGPGDSIEVNIDSTYFANTTSNNKYSLYLKVAVVMANGNIVDDPGFVHINHNVKNIGLIEKKYVYNFKVFPNPTSGFINLELPQNFEGTIKLYSLSGKLLQRQSVITQEADVHSLSLESYPAGVYLIQIESDGRRFQKRIIKN